MSENNRKRRVITLRNALVYEFVMLVLIGMILFLVETAVTEYNQRQTLLQRLDKVADTFDDAYGKTQEVTKMFDDNMQAKAEAIAYMIDHTPGFVVDYSVHKLFDVDQIMVGYQPDIKDVGFRYYTTETESGTIICVKKSSADLDELLNNIYTENRILQKIINHKDLFFVVTNNVGQIVYYPDDSFIGRNITDLGLRLSDLVQNDAKWLKIDKKHYYTSSVINEHLGITVACGISSINMTRNSHIAVGILFVAICIVFTVFITYAYFTKQDMKRFHNDSNPSLDPLSKRKLTVFAIIGLLVIGITGYYVQTLFSLTMFSLDKNSDILELSSSIEESENSVEQLIKLYDEANLNKAQIVSEMLSRNPDLRTRENLKDLSDIFDLEYIMLFNGEGEETMSDSTIFGFVISDDPEDQSYEFRMLKHGVPYVIQEAQPDELTGTYHQFIGVTMHDPAGEYDGFLQTANDVSNLETVLEQTEVANILESNLAGTTNEVFAIDANSGKFIYSSIGDHADQLAVDYGMTEAQIKNKYYGYIRVDGTKYYSQSFQKGDNLIYVCENTAELFRGRLPVTIVAVLLCIFNMLMFTLYIHVHDVTPLKTVEDDPYVDVIVAGGQQKRSLNIISRMLRERVTWEKKSAEEKTGIIVQIVISILAIAGLILIIMRNVLYTDDSIFGFIMSGKWQRGLNVFALTEVLFVLFIYFMVSSVLRLCFNEAIKLVTPKSETMLRLLSSFMNYLATIFVIFYCLSLVGFDSQSLLASAGILTLVIGLGARDLVTDILAGIFIIFENEFQVGDIIEINGYKGRVIEIGIRTTRLMSTIQDVKSVNNRNLTNIVNKTKKNSYCDVIINIPFDQNIEAIEEMLLRELPKIKDTCPYILNGPNYGGIDDMSGRTMRLSIRTECLEDHKFDVRTAVNREIKRLFEENNFKLM